jgi:outer membrane protein assembly factor BamB
MSLGRKVLDLAEQQGLLDGKAITELRKKVAESKFVITPEAIAKVLVDHGHLTPFQARKLVSQALGNEPDPVEKKSADRARATAKTTPLEDLTFADEEKTRRPPPKPAPREEEDIVDLELIDEPGPGARPAGATDLGATADDYVDLEAVDPAPAARGQRWKTDVPELNETIEMSPLDVAGPAPELEPIDDLFELDPVPAKSAPSKPASPPARPSKLKSPSPPSDPFALGPLQPLPPATPRAIGRPLKNVWDSPFLLIGGGLLGVIVVAFALLFYALTRGTAAELFSKAEEEYRSGSFTSASALYDQFLKKYPSDASASLARVRRGMATLRQIADEGSNPRLSLETAEQILPEIEKEEKFAEARAELSSILPAIADGLASRAIQTADPERKLQTVELASRAMALVNNPSYLPSSLRQDRESQISRIVDKLKVAERGIQQDKDLAAAVKSITEAAKNGQAAEGYRLRSELIRTYPALESHPNLVAAIRTVGEKERELVKVTNGGPAPLTDDHPPTTESVVLSAASGDASAPASGVASLLVQGSIYGIDIATGRIHWRRFIGHEATLSPVDVALGNESAVAIFDARRQELALVAAKTGALRWRQPLGEEAAGVAHSGSRFYVTTRTGKIISLSATSGEIVASAQLPQGAAVGLAIRQSRLFQLGEHSTLFVLDADSLACVETFYLGHKAGAVLVPPVAVLDHIVLFESPADDYSHLQLLALDNKSKKWSLVGQPRRLKGRVVVPPAVAAARLAVTTDLGQVSVFHLDAQAAEPLRLIASVAASESDPLVTYAEIDRKNRLWLAGRRRTMYEIQETLQQLSLKWTENHDDRFVAPPQLHGETLITARRRTGIDALLLEACNAATGQNLWTTRIDAAPLALVPNEAGSSVTVLTTAGQLFHLTDESFKAGAADKPTHDSSIQSSLAASLSADKQTLAWSKPNDSSEAYTCSLTSTSKPRGLSFAAPLAVAAVPFGDGLLGPLVDGRVSFITSAATTKIGPFMPPLMPDALPLWTTPATISPTTFLISDGRTAVYAVAKKDQPQPHLAAIGQTSLDHPVTSLLWAGSAAIGLARQPSSDALVGFDDRAAITFQPLPLEGRVEAGPFAVGGLALVAAEPDGFVCVTNDGQLRWKQPLARGPLAGSPLALTDGDLLVAHQSGDVCRLDAASGRELAHASIGQPLGSAMCLLGASVIVAGHGGVVHRLKIPPRP